MKNKIEQEIFEKMKVKDFGESMCNETKLKVLRWTMQQLRKHDFIGSLPCEHSYSRSMNQSYPRKCIKCGEVEKANLLLSVRASSLTNKLNYGIH